jgi:hypothetical protein
MMTPEMDVIQLASILQANIELQDVFNYGVKTVKYIVLVRLLKTTFSTLQVSYLPEPPPELPVNMHDFLD